MKIFKVIPLFLLVTFICMPVLAQEFSESPVQNSYEGKVIRVIEEYENPNGGYYQKLEIQLIDRTVQVEHGIADSPSTQKFSKNDLVVLAGYTDTDGNEYFFIDDYVRRSNLLSLFIIFLALSILVAGKRGITSLIGMFLTFFFIFWLVLPKISSGSNPFLVILLFSLIAIPITFYLSHGFNSKTNAAIVGTFIALLVTILLASIYVNSAKLTGFISDEASFLQLAKGGVINMKGILLAGIIIGVLGVLDDITVSQSAIVFQLKSANTRLSFSELFVRAMDVGKDHIASMVNTLILVYAGASLPLLLLFTDSSRTFGSVINYEIIASEVVRTLIGSIGLILAVPITTAIAAVMADSGETRRG